MEYLDFKQARCKDCYKCLRECPVKAIDIKDHQAKIIEDRCILCGHCTTVCPQDAKRVHCDIDIVEALISSGQQVIASVAPAFVSSFSIQDFSVFKLAMLKLGFSDAQETSIAANLVTSQYKADLESGNFKNYITSACPAACRMIQLYYPKALKYLAPVDSPMVAHAKMLKQQFPDAKVVFIGPCISKKREAAESQIVDAVLTFEDINLLFAQKSIVLEDLITLGGSCNNQITNRAKIYPIRRGIIKSFDERPSGYEYVAVDTISRCAKVLENIDELSGFCIEINTCEDGCVNGPCSAFKGGTLKATSDLRQYAKKDLASDAPATEIPASLELRKPHPRLRNNSVLATEKELENILRKTGKVKPEDELNCGACGYNNCREKAWAVYNGYADLEICLPYMRKRAESMAYEVIQNSPNGILIIDGDMKITEINDKAISLLGIEGQTLKGRPAVDVMDATDYMMVYNTKKPIVKDKVHLKNTDLYVDLSIHPLKEQEAVFGIMKDISKQVTYDHQLTQLKIDTLETTDEVIQKQMRVAQEIASLLGETTAETKLALLKLKRTLKEQDKK